VLTATKRPGRAREGQSKAKLVLLFVLGLLAGVFAGPALFSASEVSVRGRREG